MKKYQFVSWFPTWVGVGFAREDKPLLYLFDWYLWLGFWAIHKWHIMKPGDVEKHCKLRWGKKGTEIKL